MRPLAIILMCALCSLSLCPSAEAAVGCTLDNPQDDLARYFEDFSDFRMHTLSFALQAPKGHDALKEALGGELDPLYESIDVPYALYSVFRKGERLGYAFGANQRGTYSNIQLVALTDASGRLIDVYLQKLRSPDYAAFTSQSFLKTLARIPLSDFGDFDACFKSDKCEGIPLKDPSDGRQHEDFKAIIRGMAKLYHLSTLLLKPGQTPRYRDTRAMSEYVDEFWIPEQGFGPLDRPPKVSTENAAEHILDPESMVAVLRGRDRTLIYPISLLTNHPVIQDELDGRILTLAWSSASHTLTLLESVGRTPLRFSHTMNLLFGHQNLLERSTRSEWSALLASPLRSGTQTERRLSHVPGPVLMPWKLAERLFPSADVAVPHDPYSRHKSFYKAHRERFDEPKRSSRVLVLRLNEGPHLIESRTLLSAPFYQTRINNQELLIVSDSGGRAVYGRRVEGKLLNFDLHSRDVESGIGLLSDRETGSVWEGLSGRAISGPYAGAQLQPLVFHEMPPDSAAAFFPSMY